MVPALLRFGDMTTATRISKWIAAGTGVATAAYATYVAATWLGFGRPQSTRDATRDELLDRFMARYEVCERHAIDVVTPPEVTLAAAKDLELESSRIVRAMFKGREMILRSAPDTMKRPKGLLEQMRSIGWAVLAETPNEIVMGAVTRPWDANPVFRAIAPADFAAFAEPGSVKIAWTLRADPARDGGSTFRTETRAIATDPQARKKFRWYWSFLSPGIIVIRAAMLRPVAAAAERAWRLDGDDVFPDADAQLTHAIAIDAPPSEVWPWIAQMPDGTEGFEVIRIDPGRALVLRGGGPQFDGTWAFVLEPLDGARTRLITRYRAAFRPGARVALMKPMMTTVHGFMERKQLRTIKHHAEHLRVA